MFWDKQRGENLERCCDRLIPVDADYKWFTAPGVVAI
jgi:hypothetical protein